MRRTWTVPALALALLAGSSCGGGTASPNTSPPSPPTTPVTSTAGNVGAPSSTGASAETATSLATVVALLAASGITCSHVDVENEAGGGMPGDAMCYRDDARTLEILLFGPTATRERARAYTASLPCIDVPSMRALDGLAVSVAEGVGFDVRAADSQSLTPLSLAVLNAETEKVAEATGLRVGGFTFRCSSISAGTTKIATGRSPGAIAYDGRALWVTSNRDNLVSRIDPRTGMRTDIATGRNPADVVFDGTTIWVANIGDKTLTSVSPATGATRQMALGTPAGLFAAADHLWVIQPATRDVAGSLLRVNPVTGSRMTVAAGTTPTAVVYDGTSLWVTDPSSGTLWKVDPSTGTSTPLVVGGAPAAIVFDGSSLWITDRSRAAVARIVPATGARTDLELATPASALHHAGRKVYVGAVTTLSVFDVESGTRVDHPLESVIGDIVVADGDVWVTLPLQDAIEKITI